MRSSVALLAVLATLGAGCITRLPQRPRPQPGASELPPSDPVPAGHGRVYLTTQDGPAMVTEQTPMGPRIVCTTPCYTDLLLGEHVLRYQAVADPRRTEKVALTVLERERITGYRRAIGFYDAKLGRKIVGGVGLYGGSAGLLVSFMLYVILGSLDEDLTPAHITLGVSAGMMTFGGYMLHTGRTVVQEGSGAHWTF